MRVASHLGATVNELRQRISYSELFEWLAFLDWEEFERTHKWERYFAQLTAEFVRSQMAKRTDRAKVKDDNYIIRFVSRKAEEDGKARMKRSKAAWGAALGIKRN